MCIRDSIRRVYNFGLNTINVGLFRYQSGMKPNFLLWKNKAIELYIKVNTAFAEKKVNSVKDCTSIWVDEALQARVKSLPKNILLEWELLKFNEVPKIVSVQPMMIPGRPLEHIQLVYRFNTRQRLIKIDKCTEMTDTVERDVIDYISFFCDATTNEMYIMGSLFESKPEGKLPKKTYSDDNKEAIRKMRICGDLYRVEPVDGKST